MKKEEEKTIIDWDVIQVDFFLLVKTIFKEDSFPFFFFCFFSPLEVYFSLHLNRLKLNNKQRKMFSERITSLFNLIKISWKLLNESYVYLAV